MNALPPPPSQPPGRGTAPAIPTSPTATAPPARGAVATAPATNDAPAASKAPVPPPSGSPQSRCQLPIVQDLPRNRRRRGSETALPAPSAGPASPEGPTHKQIDGSPPPTHSAGSGRGKPADPQDQSVHGSNAPHHTGNPAHLVTASATPLVISLDSQNQDYLPDLSGPTGNCQKLAAEFRERGAVNLGAGNIHCRDAAGVDDVVERIGIEHEEVGAFAGREGAGVGETEKLRRAAGRRHDH